MDFINGDSAAYLLVSAKCLLALVCVLFLLSGVDDLFIDVCFVIKSVLKMLRGVGTSGEVTEDDLFAKREQTIAVIIPAWDESAVIRPMLQNILSTLTYENYHVFVGTYPNDTATQDEVDQVRARDSRVHRTTCPHDGPTNKADCLNWIYQGIKSCEAEKALIFDVFIMQDCEDVIHPLCYKVVNHLMPDADMVQLPVRSLNRKWWEFTAGHYMDEFAQLHMKDLTVRQQLSGSIPAAGVGCAFSRKAFTTMAAHNNGRLFNVDSLTEDYDFGLRLRRFGMTQVFANTWIRRRVLHQSSGERAIRERTVREFIDVREYFPSAFRAAVRQKARWVVGISFQGLSSLGWHGDMAMKYMLLRDRKALATNLVNLAGYLVVLLVVGLWCWQWIDPNGYRYPSLIEPGTWLWYVVIANAALLGIRSSVRAACVYRLHGALQALLSVPRMIWGNFINFGATWRAWRLYLKYLWSGTPIGWDKTAHVYPGAGELRPLRRRLGELLVERKIITISQLEEALVRQRSDKRLLGSILVEMGVLPENELSDILKSSLGS